MVIYKNILSKINLILLASILLFSMLLPLILSNKVEAAPTVTITSPTSNQQIPGTNFTVTGTATPNTTVVVSNNGSSFAQTKSDALGNWSTSSSLPAGNVKITAKAIQNPDYGYFPTSSLDFSSTNFNRIRISDNAINPGGGAWPVNSPRFQIGLMPSPVNKIFYTTNAFNPAALPEKFDASNPAEPVPASGTFPTDPQTNKGDYNSTGTKYYTGSISPNHVVSVVDVVNNAHLTDIDVGNKPVTVWTAPNGKIYAAMSNNQVIIINPDTDTIESTVNIPCVTPDSVSVVTFSQDNNYPYYYVPCVEDGLMIKMKLSDNTAVGTFNIGDSPVTSVLSLDNKRLFTSDLTGSGSNTKIKVINTENGSIITTIDLTAGAIAVMPTPDFQKLYIATPENSGNFTVENIDVIDTTTYAKTSVATTGFASAITFSPSEIAEAEVDVSFVLGATTTAASGTLAETGVLAISTILLMSIIVAITVYLYIDYRKHKKPLVEINPNVHYTFAHHVRMVNIPLLKYRLTFSVEKKHGSFNKF